MHKLAKLVVKRRNLLIGFPQDGVPTRQRVAECSHSESDTEVEGATEGGFSHLDRSSDALIL